MLDAPVAQAIAPQAGPNPRWRMLLYNLKMQRKVYYMERATANGPRHAETWNAQIILLDGPEGKVIATYHGQANTRQAAREEASGRALAALGYY
ncbi:hypothetical protein FRC01_002469 [Tulasnella sp. 417]|nr:hypothetical protein FRC01_002469 [Tulasnella sp. 417]